MATKVHLYTSLKSYTNGRSVVEVNGTTLGSCLNDLVRQFPKIKQVLFDKYGRLLPKVFVSVNMQSAYPEELEKPIKDGDELYIALVISGG